MLVYLAAAYTQIDVKDRDGLMDEIMAFASKMTKENPDWHIVSPLFGHYMLKYAPWLIDDYAFWGEYSRELLIACKKIIVYHATGTNVACSVGVQDEISLATEMQMPVTHFYPDNPLPVVDTLTPTIDFSVIPATRSRIDVHMGHQIYKMPDESFAFDDSAFLRFDSVDDVKAFLNSYSANPRLLLRQLDI